MKKFVGLIIGILVLNIQIIEAQTTFPKEQPQDGNFNGPKPNEVLDVSPPGFSWWRAAQKDKIHYLLRIEDSSGNLVYESQMLRDPVHTPSRVLPSGNYSWSVEALNGQGEILSVRPAQKFAIADNASELPWVEPARLLENVEPDHPRLLFPASKLNEVRASLNTSRKEAYEELKKMADKALELGLMEKPDFDKYDIENEYPARRTAYRASYLEFTRVYSQGMSPLALMYLMTGEEKYGLAAKKHLLHVLDWEIDGIASLDEGFDEIGLRIARTAAQGYDWLYDILTEDELEAIRQMLLARGDQMLARLESKDFLNYSAYSHDGRLPGYLMEFAIALAEEDRAKVWLDYALRTLLTVYPHWGDNDGGWAEGARYAVSYNDRLITPIQSLYAATGFNLWKKPYYRNFRYFLMYCTSPLGEVIPFGDMEHSPIKDYAGDLYSILKFHSLTYGDPISRWWADHFQSSEMSTRRFGPMHSLIHPDDIGTQKPTTLPPDKAFPNIGWAALHSNILNPEDDLMVLFKSSPFGAVSHSHADQNSFAIMKGGKALAHPSGARYPQHFSPFHVEYSRQTIAHNALLINGKGQVNRDAAANGKLSDFKSTAHLGYASGDAQKCYGDRLDFYQRHVIMIRPSVILIIDDMEGKKPFSVDWLLHGKEKMKLDSENQVIKSSRADEEMKTRLFALDKLEFGLTDKWPIDPKKDYPMVTAEPPSNEWHFSAKANKEMIKRRIAAVILVKENGEYPLCYIKEENGRIMMDGKFKGDEWSGLIDLNTDNASKGNFIEVQYIPQGAEESEVIQIAN